MGTAPALELNHYHIELYGRGQDKSFHTFDWYYEYATL